MSTDIDTDIDTTGDFEAVALAFVADLDRRDGATLARYLARYPHYAHELTMLAVETAAQEGQAVAVKAPPAALMARLRDDARMALLPALAAGERQTTEEETIPGLLAQARAHAGLTPRALAGKLGIGVDVLALLEERHIAPDTIVAPFIARLAAILGASSDAIRAYLAGPPMAAAPGVAYHAPRGHQPARRLTFQEAIAESNLTTPEQKAEWLGE